MRKTTLEEHSAGGVVYRAKYEFLLGKHSGYHKWVLPKGHLEKGETVAETAVREVREELGVAARIVGGKPIKTIDYWFYEDPDESGETTRTVARYQEQGGKKIRIHKKVDFFLMEAVEDGVRGWEMEQKRWVSYEEGMKLLAFETEKEVFEVAGKALRLRSGL